MRIREMNISARSRSCLLRAGFEDIEELKDISDDELLRIKNLNTKCVGEIRNAISSYFVLNDEDECGLDFNEYSAKVTGEIAIDELDFSYKVRNCLERAGIYTIDDLCGMTLRDLIKIRNLGRKSAEEIVRKLNEHGLVLRGEEKESREESSNDGKTLDSETNYNSLGVQAYDDGDYELAIDLFKRALQSEDKEGTISCNLGRAYLMLAKTKNADCIEEAISNLRVALNKRNKGAAYSLADIYNPNHSYSFTEKIQSVDKAIYYFIKYMEFTEYDSGYLPKTLNSICVMLYNHGNRDKQYFYAAICAALANKMDPEDETIRDNLDGCFEEISPSEIETIQLINVNIGLVAELLREIIGYNRIEELLEQQENI